MPFKLGDRFHAYADAYPLRFKAVATIVSVCKGKYRLKVEAPGELVWG